jgi:hypothetical protein
MGEWSFLTNHSRALLCIADDPEVRLRDIASALDITERSAYGIVSDLASAGYIVKERNGRRNTYQIRDHLPLRESNTRERSIGDLIGLLVDGTPVKSAKKIQSSAATKSSPKGS